MPVGGTDIGPEYNDLFGVGIYELALGLRNQASGLSDPWDEADIERIDRYLRLRLQHWKPPTLGSEKFDNAIKAAVEAALYEYKVWGA